MISPLALFHVRDILQLVKWGERWPEPAGKVYIFRRERKNLQICGLKRAKNCALAPVLYHRHIVMIISGTLKKSFAGFVHFFLVWWGYDWILDGDSQILRAAGNRSWG